MLCLRVYQQLNSDYYCDNLLTASTMPSTRQQTISTGAILSFA